LKLWLSLFFTQRRQTATKRFPTFKVDIAVSYVGHALQTCHVITSIKCATTDNITSELFLSHEAK